MPDPTPPEIVRKRLMQAIKTRFEDRQAGVDGAIITWNRVIRAPLSTIEKRIGNMLGITTGDERVIKRDMTLTRVLPVIIEFEARSFLGEDVEDAGIDILAEIQGTVHADLQFGGLCLHMYETGNTLDVDGENDRTIGGLVFFEATYRHLFDDPRRRPGE